MLTVQINGTTSASLIRASWWNDYYNLFTGTMQDQPVTIANNLTLKSTLSQASVGSLSAVAQSGGSMGVGTYVYAYTDLTGDGGESLASNTVGVTTTSVNKKVQLSNLPIGPTGTVGRSIYRSKVNTSSPLYYLTYIGDNTTTSYSDSAADSSLNTFAPTPSHSTFGGALIFKDASGAKNLVISADGTITGAGGSTSFGNTTISGVLTVTGDTYTDGKLSKLISGDIIDASGANTTYIKSMSGAGGIAFQVPNNTTIATINAGGMTLGSNALTVGNVNAATLNASGLSSLSALTTSGAVNLQNTTINIVSGATISAANLSFSGTGMVFSAALQINGTLLLAPGNTGTPSNIQVGTAGFGVKNNGGTRLMEVKNNGNMFIAGTTYYTTQSTVNYTASGAFDSFDIGEVYKVDQEYGAGVVVCPADVATELAYSAGPTVPLVSQCTHDKCNLSMIIVTLPGYCMGAPNVPSEDWYDNTMPLSQATALSGRVFAKTAYDIPARSYVCSDGRGGVRAVATGESAYAIGVAMGPTVNAMIPVMIRPTFVVN